MDCLRNFFKLFCMFDIFDPSFALVSSSHRSHFLANTCRDDVQDVRNTRHPEFPDVLSIFKRMRKEHPRNKTRVVVCVIGGADRTAGASNRHVLCFKQDELSTKVLAPSWNKIQNHFAHGSVGTCDCAWRSAVRLCETSAAYMHVLMSRLKTQQVSDSLFSLLGYS